MYEEEEDDVFANQELIHIHKINTRGRKKETRVIGIPDIFDFKKILKFWKKVFLYRFRTFKPTAESPRRVNRLERKARKDKKRMTKKVKIRDKPYQFRETTGNKLNTSLSSWELLTSKISESTVLPE